MTPVLAIAPDGTGVVAYRQIEGTTARAWASRRVNGVWQPPQQLTGGMQSAVSNIAVGAANGGKVIVAFKGGTDPGDAAFRYAPGAGQLFGPLENIRQSDVTDLALATNAAGVSYALVKTATNLFAYRIVGGVDAPVGAPDAVDTNANDTDIITERSIAVDAAGNAVAAWAQDPAPRTALARRITGTTLAAAAVQASGAPLGGFAATGRRRRVGVDSDDAGRAWVTFRQAVRVRRRQQQGSRRGAAARGRRLRGSAALRQQPARAGHRRDVELPSLAVTPSGGLALATGHSNTAATRGALPGLRRHRRARLGQSLRSSSHAVVGGDLRVGRGRPARRRALRVRDPAERVDGASLQARDPAPGRRARPCHAHAVRPRARAGAPDNDPLRGRRRGLGVRRLPPGADPARRF